MDDLRISASIVIPASELAWAAVRASGPGGQNVNKVSSKVELRWDMATTSALPEPALVRLRSAEKNRIDSQGSLLLTSQKTRDQHRNLEDARERLAAMVRAALVAPKKRKPTKPSRGAKERRLTEKKQRSEIKRARRDFE